MSYDKRNIKLKYAVNVSAYRVSLKAEVACPYFCSEVNLTVKEGTKQFRVCVQLAEV